MQAVNDEGVMGQRNTWGPKGSSLEQACSLVFYGGFYFLVSK